MKKNKAVTFFMLTLSSSLFAVAPKWLTSLEKVYPTKEYIRMIGEGSTIKKAESDAVSSLALNFKTKVQFVTKAVSEYNSIVDGERTHTTQEKNLLQKESILSDAEFFCIHFSEPYYSKNEKKYYVAGFINRAEAWKYYEGKIEPLFTETDIVLKNAADENEILYQLLYLQKAKKLLELASYYIDASLTVNPDGSEMYIKKLNDYAKIKALAEGKKKAAVFYVDCKNKDYSSLVAKINSLMQESGFVLSNNKSRWDYRIFVDLHFSEESYEAGDFVRPDMNIIIENKNGQQVESYSKAYPRYTHSSIKNAYSLALVRLGQDLEENFLAAYRDF